MAGPLVGTSPWVPFNKNLSVVRRCERANKTDRTRTRTHHNKSLWQGQDTPALFLLAGGRPLMPSDKWTECWNNQLLFPHFTGLWVYGGTSFSERSDIRRGCSAAVTQHCRAICRCTQRSSHTGQADLSLWGCSSVQRLISDPADPWLPGHSGSQRVSENDLESLRGAIVMVSRNYPNMLELKNLWLRCQLETLTIERKWNATTNCQTWVPLLEFTASPTQLPGSGNTSLSLKGSPSEEHNHEVSVSPSQTMVRRRLETWA